MQLYRHESYYMLCTCRDPSSDKEYLITRFVIKLIIIILNHTEQTSLATEQEALQVQFTGNNHTTRQSECVLL